VRPGDELTLCITVLASRISSAGTVGIVRWRLEVTNQDDIRVLNLIATSFFNVPEARQWYATGGTLHRRGLDSNDDIREG
jgi:hypothetical protein